MYAVTAFGLAPNAVNTTKIANGTIQAVDVDPAGGLYASKTSTYVATTQRPLPPGYCVEVIAICADANDLPLSGACNTPPATPIAITRTYLGNWSTTSSPASYLCDVCNNHSTTVTIEAQLVCVSVPGS
jgi:hypothetical protein